ncbi:MAG: selenium-dependent molybdenum cofactor biosynthesis protein YqeB [Clostridia bacterium]|nr:selenium-dependent molybdenum cofactor biosynthesis protein YqeB [Clostridia bacterium]
MFILIKGAGDLASGIALRLFHCGMDIAMTELEKPTSIRRTVCFSEAISHGSTTVEDVEAVSCQADKAREITGSGKIAVIADPECNCLSVLRPDVLIDARLLKRNEGTKLTDAPLVIGIGPGYTAGVDCHAVIETQRGHTLGRVIREGSAEKNTGVPGFIAGFSVERLLRSPDDGIFQPLKKIGDTVKKGDVTAVVNGKPMTAQIDGIIRGLLPKGAQVYKGMKSGDIDPRCEKSHCFTVSDKALAIAGGVLEAILWNTNQR